MGLFNANAVILIAAMMIITFIAFLIAVFTITRWAYYKFSKNTITYKSFYKKPVTMIFFIIAAIWWVPVPYYYIKDYLSTPVELRFLKDLSQPERIEDMINNPKKYQNLPCLEVQAGKDKYCFDRSKISSVSIYNKPQSTEFSTLKFQFISKLLPKSKRDKKGNLNYLLGDIHIHDYKKEKEVKRYLGIYKKSYKEFVRSNNDGCVNYTELLKTKPQIEIVYTREYIKKDKSIGIRARMISVDPDKYKDNYESYKTFNFSGITYQNTNKIYYTHYYQCLNRKNPTKRTNIKISKNQSWDFIVDINHYDLSSI